MDQQYFKNMMRQYGLTQEDLGRALGKDRSSISRLLAGQAALKLPEAAKLAQLFSVSQADILRHAGADVAPSDGAPELAAHTRVEKALEAFANGEMVVVTDDDDRENEGDLIVAASKMRPDQMAFMVRHTSGIVCAPIKADLAKRLRLDPMVAHNDAPLTTAFTISIDARVGTTTGISAEERTNSVRALANPNCGADDFVRPGHIFPLVAQEGGVLVRTGHTEAAVDLCTLSGLPEVGVISELINDDGTVMKGQQITEFSNKFGFAQVSIHDLVLYRQARERLVQRLRSFQMPTKYGLLNAYAYVTPFEPIQHIAIVMGQIGDGQQVLTRLHREDVLDDVFSGGAKIDAALARLAKEGRGVLVYLREGAAGVPVLAETTTGSAAGRAKNWREIGVGAQILRDLGVRSIRLLTSSNHKFVALGGFGISISSQEAI